MDIETERASPQTTADVTVHIVARDTTTLESITTVLAPTGCELAAHLDGAAFLARIPRTPRACAVLDHRFAHARDCELLRTLLEGFDHVPALVYGRGSVTAALRALRHGAVDFLEVPIRPEVLLERVGHAMKVAHVRQVRSDRARDIRRRVRTLTPRQAEILPMLCSGMTVKRVAFELGLSPKTVQIHRARILDHMMVDSIVKLANLCHELNSAAPAFPLYEEDSESASTPANHE